MSRGYAGWVRIWVRSNIFRQNYAPWTYKNSNNVSQEYTGQVQMWFYFKLFSTMFNVHLALMYLGVRQFLTSPIFKLLQTPRGHPCRIDTFLVFNLTHSKWKHKWILQDVLNLLVFEYCRIHLLKKHSRRVQSCASDPAGKHVASASWDCTVTVWSLVKGESVCDLRVGR